MKVKELIEALQRMNSDSVVYFEYNNNGAYTLIKDVITDDEGDTIIIDYLS